MKRIALVLDLDATPVDSMPDLRAALNVMLAELRRRELTPDEVHSMIGDGARLLGEVTQIIRRAAKELGTPSGIRGTFARLCFAALAGNEF
jgi:phosphoglycolate phosphatase-like HAD superfamily hydrolase